MFASERMRTLVVIFACVTIYGLTSGLIRPLLALILESRGIDRTFIGLNAAMPAFGMMIISPLIPRLIKSLGIKRFLFSCLIVDVSTVLCYPLLDYLYAWFAISLIAGAAANALLVASETWINALAVDATRGRVVGTYNAMLIAAIAMGPLIIPITGIQGWTPFLVGAVFVVLASVPLFWVGPSLTGVAMDVWEPHGFAIVFIVASTVFVMFATGRWILAKDKTRVL